MWKQTRQIQNLDEYSNYYFIHGNMACLLFFFILAIPAAAKVDMLMVKACSFRIEDKKLKNQI
jgi:hypothetical protein